MGASPRARVAIALRRLLSRVRPPSADAIRLAEKAKGLKWLQDNDLSRRYPHYAIGRASYGNPTIQFANEGARLSIGNFCSLAEDVTILLGGNHRPDWVTIFPFNVFHRSHWDLAGHPHSKGDVTIGHDVWIGAGATLLSGITIGNGAVIGARAVVTSNVPPYGVAVGNPARVVKYRFDPATIARLQALAWWDWPDLKIEALVPLMLSDDIERFLLLAE